MPKGQSLTVAEHGKKLFLDDEYKIGYEGMAGTHKLSKEAQRLIYFKFVENAGANEVRRLYMVFANHTYCIWSAGMLEAVFLFMKSRINNISTLSQAELHHWVSIWTNPWETTAGDNAQAETAQFQRLSLSNHKKRGILVGYILVFGGSSDGQGYKDTVLHLDSKQQAFVYTAIALEGLTPDDTALAFNGWSVSSTKSAITGLAVNDIVGYIRYQSGNAIEISDMQHWNYVTQGADDVRDLVRGHASGVARRITDTTAPSSALLVNPPSSFASTSYIEAPSMEQSQASYRQEPWQPSQLEYPHERQPPVSSGKPRHASRYDLDTLLPPLPRPIPRPIRYVDADTSGKRRSRSPAQELSLESKDRNYRQRDRQTNTQSRVSSTSDSLYRLDRAEEVRQSTFQDKRLER